MTNMYGPLTGLDEGQVENVYRVEIPKWSLLLYHARAPHQSL